MDADRAQRLQEFVDWCSQHIRGDEKSEAQLFIDRFIKAFGQPGALEVGGQTEYRVRKRADDQGGVAFADYVWKPWILIEMKRRGADLSRHYRQAFDYWVRLVPDRPRYVVLCNFDEFWVYDFDTQIDAPKDKVRLEYLPERYGPLAFLFPTHEKPKFEHDQEEVTREVAAHLAAIFRSLTDPSRARSVDPDLARRFTLQSLIALFAEDIGLLDKYCFARLIDECKSPEDSYDLIGGLFEAMNRPGPKEGGRYKGVNYFNGGIFAHPARVELTESELDRLQQAAKASWNNVRPEIFGSIFQQSMDLGERHAFGAHFTYPVDIMKIVNPTIVEPWTDLIENASTLNQLDRLRVRMCSYKVLDPACGSGNFLYLAYRELRRLEARLNERYIEISKSRKAVQKVQLRLSHVSLKQFYGMDINPFAVELAKVTLLIGHKLAVDELGLDEAVLPLDNLDANFLVGDALIRVDPADPARPILDDTGRAARTDWFPADVVIGNPPFLGAKRMKPERGDPYVTALRKAYPEVPGMADYCVYWIRRTADHIPPCTPERPEAGRAGLVGTQNIRNNKSREGGLDRVVEDSTIIEAVDNQPWSGEANVHVSIVNWVRTKDENLLPTQRKLWFVRPEPAGSPSRRGEGLASKRYNLDIVVVSELNASLTSGADTTIARELLCNTLPRQSFNGQMIGHAAFLLSDRVRADMIRSDPRCMDIIYPYLNGREFLSGKGIPERYVLDFGDRDKLRASEYAVAYEYARTKVLPDRQRKAEVAEDGEQRVRSHHKGFLERWWQLSFSRPELIRTIENANRYIACSLVTKRAVFVFVSAGIRPSNLLQVFPFNDDYTFGVLQSGPHWDWFKAKSSKLKSDYRFGESVWNTFPFPQSPAPKQIDAVAEAARAVRRVRAEHLPRIKGGLRALYRTLETPGRSPLRDAHATLDEAVMAAYSFNPRKDLLKQLLDLNLEVAARIDSGEDVTPPGVPPSYPDAKRASLVTDDCIMPPEA